MDPKIINNFISCLNNKSNNLVKSITALGVAISGDKEVATIPIQKPATLQSLEELRDLLNAIEDYIKKNK